jgi:hypothetical protein
MMLIAEIFTGVFNLFCKLLFPFLFELRIYLPAILLLFSLFPMHSILRDTFTASFIDIAV